MFSQYLIMACCINYGNAIAGPIPSPVLNVGRATESTYSTPAKAGRGEGINSTCPGCTTPSAAASNSPRLGVVAMSYVGSMKFEEMYDHLNAVGAVLSRANQVDVLPGPCFPGRRLLVRIVPFSFFLRFQPCSRAMVD